MDSSQAMTSMLCSKQTGGVVDVHDKIYVEELTIDGNDNIQTRMVSKNRSSDKVNNQRPMSTPNPQLRGSSSRGSIDAQGLIGQTLKLQDWLSDRSMKSVQEKADVETKSTRKMYNSLLETEDTFIKDLDNMLSHKEVLDLRKKEMLHKKWMERVQEPIQTQIVSEMKGPVYPELDRRKRELFKEYLEHVNKKGHVFLDTIAPDEYYPMSLHPTRPSLLTAETRSLRDPLLSQERERTDEERHLMRCLNGANYSDKDIAQIRLPPLPLVPLGRHGTGCSTWLAMPLTDIESPVRLASRRRMRGNFNQTKVDFEAWGRLPFSSNIVDEEMQTQKKRMFAFHVPVYVRPGKTSSVYTQESIQTKAITSSPTAAPMASV